MAKKYTIDELKKIYKQFDELVNDSGTYYIVVDKQLATRKTVINALSSEGVEKDCIIECPDAMTALDALRKHEKNDFMILTELTLPDRDGLKFIQRIKEERKEKKDKIIAVTAETKKERIAIAGKLGINGYIKKPFQPQNLIKQLKEYGAL
jgi:CheY-like chemotaxis protein